MEALVLSLPKKERKKERKRERKKNKEDRQRFEVFWQELMYLKENRKISTDIEILYILYQN